MKKCLFVLVTMIGLSGLISCGTTAVKGSGMKGKPAKIDTGRRVVIDYQGATFGSEMPEWVRKLGEGNVTSEALKSVMPGVKGKKIFAFTVRGQNLDFVEQWGDLVHAETRVASIMESVMGKSVSAKMQGTDDEKLERVIDMYRTSLSSVRLSGLEKVASYWVKSKVVDDSGETLESYYEYHAVWGIDENIFKQQLTTALERVSDTTTEGVELKKKILSEIMENVAVVE